MSDGIDPDILLSDKTSSVSNDKFVMDRGIYPEK